MLKPGCPTIVIHIYLPRRKYRLQFLIEDGIDFYLSFAQ